MGGWVARPARRSSHGRTRRIDPVDRARRGSILAVNGRGPPTWESVRRHHRPSPRPPHYAPQTARARATHRRCRRRVRGDPRGSPIPLLPALLPSTHGPLLPLRAPPRQTLAWPSPPTAPAPPPALPCAWPAAPTAAIVLRRRPSPDALECAGKVPFLCAEFRLVAEVQVAAGIFKSPA